ncbi:MAG: SDR family NAD(P)-dependent oxidoreductase [Desulfobacterales bacterium]
MFWEQPVENSVRQMDVNVNALFYAIHEFLPEMMKRNSGHIVNVSSGVAITSAPGAGRLHDIQMGSLGTGRMCWVPGSHDRRKKGSNSLPFT